LPPEVLNKWIATPIKQDSRKRGTGTSRSPDIRNFYKALFKQKATVGFFAGSVILKFATTYISGDQNSMQCLSCDITVPQLSDHGRL
jgi:hypothetical protein